MHQKTVSVVYNGDYAIEIPNSDACNFGIDLQWSWHQKSIQKGYF